jgi:hypothetical protein
MLSLPTTNAESVRFQQSNMFIVTHRRRTVRATTALLLRHYAPEIPWTPVLLSALLYVLAESFVHCRWCEVTGRKLGEMNGGRSDVVLAVVGPSKHLPWLSGHRVTRVLECTGIDLGWARRP